ncbi:hypothetical protein BO94DRAFT_599803 [Aspergillus sclerotioniger CBS 115572]|uniref:Zn(2)-C6 fungal-type domain-containing protein n=1 Tax=Aspergillus sclerotioniger CBS 115572 TaxID=1450535 RepID=A0A317W9F4_9EURO|nr:hypothetical protein BO94DRAFT_599803 [Aspergillus sclerotioniger CBS 115572]PWY83246.1 hypothetical protein BO94DRAFT_599803 [Aspergillus sclerotioniger CBS 115572]
MAASTISRTRTGCWACRARRVKCDETHPVCRRCARNNRSCGYGLRLTWLEESIAKGICHGRMGVWSKNGQKKGETDPLDLVKSVWCSTPSPHRRWMFLHTSVHDVERFCVGYQGSKNHRIWPKDLWQLSISPAISTKPVTCQSQSTDDSTLLAFFETVICSSSTLVDNAQSNPYRYLILPMAFDSEGIYHAALAISANTLRLSESRYHVPALKHHHRALLYLQSLLGRGSWTDREMIEILGLVLMICWFEISDNSRPSWVTHLDGLQNVMSARKKQCQQALSWHSQELLGFFDRYFAFHLVLARTAFRWTNPQTQPCLSSIPLCPSSPDTIDPYMGFSHSLLLLINRIADVAWAESDVDAQTVYGLKDSLEMLHQTPPDGDVDSHSSMTIAEANRLGAMLLLYEICSSSKFTPSFPSFAPEDKNTCVRQILDLIQAHKNNIMRTAVLPLWPLFLAGCCAPSDDERVAVLQLFDELEGIRRFGNITPAREVIETVWRHRDLTKTDLANDIRVEKATRFEWEHAMVTLGGWKLALT